jgi:long-chain acyl-CoA synthetase
VARDTLLDYFDGLAAIRAPYLVYDDGFRVRSHSYATVAAAARGFAARLAAAGLGKGDHAVVWSENRPEWIVAFWGCVRAGVVVVPIDARTSAAFVGRVTDLVHARLLVVGDDVTAPAAPGLPVWRLGDLDWRDGQPPAVTISRDDVAEVVFTSGATDEPKGVVITHRNVLANVVPIEREIDKYRRWARPVLPLRLLNLLPLSHLFGQALAAFIPPLLPATVVFIRGQHPADVVATIRRRRISALVCVPKMLELLRGHVLRTVPGAGEAPRPGRWMRRWWQYRRLHDRFGWTFWSVVVGGAPLDPELEAFWASRAIAVIQGYGLTETAPIVTLSHPFKIRSGSVGTPIAGVEVRLAPDGEILVRGENVARGYLGGPARDGRDGWLHTGDLGAIGEGGQVYIRGRKKDVIVAADGTNVYPEDVERTLERIAGVREAAAVGVTSGAGERVHVALVVDPGVDPARVVAEANRRLESHQTIQRAHLWPQPALPRTEGTGKLKRAAVREWVRSGAAPDAVQASTDPLIALVEQHTRRTGVTGATTFDAVGLSSLERVELLAAIEDAFDTRLDEHAFAAARDVAELRALVDAAVAQGGGAPMAGSSSGTQAPLADDDMPRWNRRAAARGVRRLLLGGLVLPLTRAFAWVRVSGRSHFDAVSGPVILASNHQSYIDTAVILAALPRQWRYRLAPAMAKEFFTAHFYPDGQSWLRRAGSGAVYRLAALTFAAFPLPQRHPGAQRTIRHMGELLDDGYAILLFPEGEITDTGAIGRFRPGIGLIAQRLGAAVMPVRIAGVDRVLHRRWKMARPGRVTVSFGPPLRPAGDDYGAIAHQVEAAVRALPPGDAVSAAPDRAGEVRA